MTDTAIEFQFEGEGAQDMAWEFSELLKNRVGLSPAVQHAPRGSDEPTRGLDPNLMVAVLSLVLTVPSAIMSLDQFAEWIKKKRRPVGAEAKAGRKVRISIRDHDIAEMMDEEDMKAILGLLEQAKKRGDAKRDERTG